jgi:hypothetical protein
MAFSAETWFKPFAVAWRARAYFAIGGALWLISLIPLPFKDTSAEWWQVVVAKAFGSLDKVSYMILLAGLVYAVFSDVVEFIWTSRLQEEMRSGVTKISGVLEQGLGKFTRSLADMSFEAVKVWVENKQGAPDQVRLIGVSSLKAFYGDHLDDDGNILHFVVDEILESSARSNAHTWENLSTNIVLRKSPVPNHFEWEETKNYTVVCPAGSGNIPIKIENSWQVGPKAIQTALEKLEYTLRIGPEKYVDFKEWLTASAQEIQQGKFDVTRDGVRLAYDGIWLSMAIELQCPIVRDKTPVSIYELSYISDQDRCYALALRHPTKGLQFTISLEGLPDWAVRQPTASASAYARDQDMVEIRQMQGRRVTGNLRGWSLPGLALIAEWTPVGTEATAAGTLPRA